MIDSTILYKWGFGVLVVGFIVDFMRFGDIKVNHKDWISVALFSSGMTLVAVSAIDMVLHEYSVLSLSSPQEYENIYLENDPNVAVVDDMAGLGMDT